jgi:guanine deaminase
MTENEFISRAIDLALQNVNSGGGPFGALVVKEGKIISEGVNRVIEKNDPTAHAEVQAIRMACELLGTFDLSGCEIYTSCEPCPMCFSAIYWAHIGKVYYAANQMDADKAGFNDAFIYNEIKMKPENRVVSFTEVENKNKIKPFDAWHAKVDKEKY